MPDFVVNTKWHIHCNSWCLKAEYRYDYKVSAFVNE
jgi:hypothetical protein